MHHHRLCRPVSRLLFGCVVLLLTNVAQGQSTELLNDDFNGSISNAWAITGTDSGATATADGNESAFTVSGNPNGTSLRLDDNSTASEVELRFTMPSGAITEGESLTLQFDFYSVDSVLPQFQVQDGTNKAGRVSMHSDFQHREGATWNTLSTTSDGQWYRIVYTYHNGVSDTADISLTPFGGNAMAWTNLPVETSRFSVNSVKFEFNIPDSLNGREYWIDNVIVSENGTGSATNDWFAALQSAPVASNPDLTWQHFGPGMSGYIDKFFINNGDPNAMYTELDLGNGHVTLDRGDFWTSYRDWDSTGTHPSSPTWMDFSYQNPDFGIMIGKDMTYRTDDRGQSWSQLIDTHPEPGNSEKHNVVAVDPSNDNNWYIGAGQGWMIKYTHYTKNGLVETNDRNHSEGFIMYSKNKGQSWTEVSAPFPADSSFSRIIVDPRNSNIVYASCQHGVFKSTNGGAGWNKVTGNGLPYNQPRDMAYYYDANTNEFLLYIVEITHYAPNGNSIDTTGGVYRSADGGDNWSNLTGDLAIDMNQITLNAYRDKYYKAIAFWLEISEASAESLYPQLPTATFSQFHQMAVDPTNKDRIYLVHNFKHDYSFPPGNIWMTDNGGVNWYAAAREGPYWANGQNASYWQSRAVQPTGMNATFAHVDREHRLSDNTQTGPRFIKTNQLGEVYTAFAQQVMRSTDNGQTWVQIDDIETSPGSGHWVGRGNSNLPGHSFNLQTTTPGEYLWGTGEHGLWRNTNDGNLAYPGALAVEQLTGQSLINFDTLSISTIAVDPLNPNTIFTLQFRQGNRGRLRRSTNGGSSWQTVSTPVVFPASNDVIDQRSLMIDPTNPAVMYFCVPYSEWASFAANRTERNGPTNFNGYGIYKSVNFGSSWTMADSGIPSNASIYRLAMDSDNSQVLYAALNETHEDVAGGLYKSTNGGASWSALTIPPGIRSVNEVIVHKTTGDVYISCGNNDADGSTGGGYVSTDGGSSWELIFSMPYVKELEASTVNPDVMVANVGFERQIGGLNSGCYVTIDGGIQWHKINKQYGQPDRVRKLRTDPHDETILWAAIHGTGFARLDISPLFAPPILLGDVNLSGTVDFLDINPFIDRLANATFQAQADMNQDGDVNFLDIAPFITTLSSQ